MGIGNRFLQYCTFCILLFFAGDLSAQKNSGVYTRVDRIALQMPQASTTSVAGIAEYVGSHFETPEDKLRAVFAWITGNISYDVESLDQENDYYKVSDVISDALKNRKGVCMHYAELFSAVANEIGVKTYVVSGYTRQNGEISKLSHAWCVSQTSSGWYFVDPTWGAGYRNDDGFFVKKLNNQWFLTKPEDMIRTHMPFDPVWQFLGYTVTNKEFGSGSIPAKTGKPFFNTADSLLVYESRDEEQRLWDEDSRIRRNGISNNLIIKRLRFVQQSLQIFNANRQVKKFNAAVGSYNEGVAYLNDFISYRNRQFKPKKTDDEIKNMLALADKALTDADNMLKEITFPDPSLKNSIVQLVKSMSDVKTNLDAQKVFLDKYMNTGKLFRRTLFYKYTWMGIPLN